MSTDITDLLHETIDLLTEGERVPDWLGERAFRRHRRRRLALGAAAATGTAVAAAAAVFVATATTGGVPQRGGGILRAQTAAYVADRTERALTAAAHGAAIERIDVTRRSENLNVVLTEHHGGAIVLRDVPGLNAGQTTFWWYRGRHRAHALTAEGRPLFDLGTIGRAARHHSGRYVFIDYPAKTWLRNFSLTAQPLPQLHLARKGSCPELIDPEATVSAAPTAWTTMIRKALACGDFRLDGRQWVDGTHAIKIVSSQRLVPRLALFAQISGTLWVDPATFLPVKVRWTWPHGTLAATFRWLPPTGANLAALNVRVPSGFRLVRLPRGTGLSFSTVTFVASTPTATPTPTAPAPTPSVLPTPTATPTPTAPAPTPSG
jgi:hypothetical protein